MASTQAKHANPDRHRPQTQAQARKEGKEERPERKAREEDQKEKPERKATRESYMGPQGKSAEQDHRGRSQRRPKKEPTASGGRDRHTSTPIPIPIPIVLVLASALAPALVLAIVLLFLFSVLQFLPEHTVTAAVVFVDDPHEVGIAKVLGNDCGGARSGPTGNVVPDTVADVETPGLDKVSGHCGHCQPIGQETYPVFRSQLV